LLPDLIAERMTEFRSLFSLDTPKGLMFDIN
jgi:hypothetical protein